MVGRGCEKAIALPIRSVDPVLTKEGLEEVSSCRNSENIGPPRYI